MKWQVPGTTRRSNWSRRLENAPPISLAIQKRRHICFSSCLWHFKGKTPFLLKNQPEKVRIIYESGVQNLQVMHTEFSILLAQNSDNPNLHPPSLKARYSRTSAARRKLSGWDISIKDKQAAHYLWSSAGSTAFSMMTYKPSKLGQTDLVFGLWSQHYSLYIQWLWFVPTWSTNIQIIDREFVTSAKKIANFNEFSKIKKNSYKNLLNARVGVAFRWNSLLI